MEWNEEQLKEPRLIDIPIAHDQRSSRLISSACTTCTTSRAERPAVAMPIASYVS